MLRTSLKNLGAITLFTEDLDATAAFYREVFGLPVVHDGSDSVAFDSGNTIINLLRTEAATNLIGPAAVGQSESGARAQLTVWVEDADAVCGLLLARGVRLINGPMDREWGQRTAAFSDPAGHVWEVAQSLSPATG